MNNPSRTNTAGEKLRIDTDIRTRVHDDIPRRQNPFQQLPLSTISVSFKSTITQAVDGKGVVVNPIANSANNRDRRHYRRLRVTVKKAAKQLGKRRLTARSTGNNAR